MNPLDTSQDYSEFNIPATPSYLVGADNHQLGNTGSSILDPTTWGDTADHAFKFSVSALTRAVSSTYNSAVSVGSLVGITDDSDKANTRDWLQGMDDDLAQYYDRNQSSINVVGDAVGMFAPGLAGMKVLNWAQKGVALAAEGRAGWTLAAHFGTLASKQAQFAELAAKEITEGTSAFRFINANLAKSLIAGYAQSALELAAFDTAAASTMKDSPMFTDHDMGDIAYNAMLGGGFIGAGIIGTTVAAKTVMDIKRAGTAIDEATHAYKVARTTPAAGTPANEELALHLNNLDSIPSVAKDDPLFKQRSRAVAELQQDELNKGRTAAHRLTGSDSELGNQLFDQFSTVGSEEAANKLIGLQKVTRVATDISRDEKALGDSASVSYYKFFGKDAGEIYDKPTTSFIADRLKSEDAVLAEVRSYRHKQGQDWSILGGLAEGQEAVESRYIQAIEGDFNPELKIGTKDIPYLERAYTELGKGAIDTVTLKDGTALDKSGLYRYLTDLKGAEANNLLNISDLDIGVEALSKEDIAKLTNVNPSLLEGTKNIKSPADDYFAMQTSANEYTTKQIAAGAWRENQGTIKTYLKPQHAKLLHDIGDAYELSQHEINGMVAIREEQQVYTSQAKNVVTNYLGQEADKLTDIPGVTMVGANRGGVGGGLFTSMNGDYKTLGSVMQFIGATTAGVIRKNHEAIDTVFAASGHKVLNDPEAGTELWKVVQQLRQTPEKYVKVGDSLTNIKQLKYEAEVAAAKSAGNDISKIAPPVFEDKAAPVTIALETDGMKQFADDWDSYHRTELKHKTNLRTSQGLTVQDDMQNIFHIPQVDSRKYPHFAFVVDDSISGTGHMSMIHAASPQELEALASKVPTESGLRVMYKSDSEEWHRAMKNYDYDLGINENYIDSALKRSGVSASFQPQTNPELIFNELMQWRKNQSAGLVRDMVEHRYSPEFEELRSQGAKYEKAATSVKGYRPESLKAANANPFYDYVSTALNVSREGTTPIWSAVNRLAETSVSNAVSKLQDTWKEVASVEDLDKINKVLKDIGCNTFEDAATHAWANHTAPKPVLSNFIRKANSILSFMMLRADPMNAVNNGLGHTVLYGTEMPKLIKDVLDSGAEGATALSDMAHIRVPGTPDNIISPAKLAANAYGDWFKKVVGNEDAGLLAEKFKANGWLPSYTDQFKSIQDNLALTGSELGVDLDKRLHAAYTAADKIEKVTGNRFTEEMNRFVSAHTAHQVTQEAIRQGVLLPELESSVINTFVNRVEGINLASQRPLMFKGPVGQAVGLFQTYQFNMLQQLFRHVGDGDKKAVATLLGLQGSIYGLNGLPAFNAMNTYLVGNAAGNISHKDVISTTYDAMGKEAGDWLLYGASSNMLLHPDAKVNLYSRGDINPRQVTVIPTTLADVPMIGATAKLFGSVYETLQKIDKGANKWGAMLQGIEHSGISRPLAGFAQTLQATNNPLNRVISTDNAGNIVMENDLFSLMTAARIAGAKPLDEAVATDAIHRIQVYNAASIKQIENLGEGIKATVLGGNIPNPEQINSFVKEYAKAGGKQSRFNQFYTRQVLNANKSKVNQMIENTKNPESQYMQKIMGGYELSDVANTPNNTTNEGE